MISSFAWQNVWRNKIRSAVIITAVALGTFAGIFTIAFTNGMVNDRIRVIIRTELSHIQIHQPGFVDNNDFTIRMSNADSILKKIKKLPHVMAAGKRIVINSMVASAETSTGVKITGIDPADGIKVSDLNSKLINGKFLEETGKNPVVIGEKLATKLKIGLRNKVVITVQDVNKNIVAGAFRVAGIFRTDNLMFDESTIFVRNSDLVKLTGLGPGEAHEIAVLLDNNELSEKTRNTISAMFPRLDVKDWQKLSPEAGYLVSAMGQYMFIFIIIIMLALCFGIINTMLMVVLERVHELGMLMAIGMDKIKVFTMIVLETVYLSLTGGALGIALGYGASTYFARNGIDLYFWKEAYAEIGYSSIVYPVIDAFTMVYTSVMVVLMGIISALYPAYKALRLNPTQAIQTE
ncbi:MAG: ABC transporter permease [Bacteroidota bacterium]|nr:ABC transporter permease [Bacteroidota bacterium]